jgi:hypothetical protein
LEGGINPSVFANGDPVNGRDPSGLAGLPQCREGYTLYGMFALNPDGSRGRLIGEPYCKYMGGSTLDGIQRGGGKDRPGPTSQCYVASGLFIISAVADATIVYGVMVASARMSLSYGRALWVGLQRAKGPSFVVAVSAFEASSVRTGGLLLTVPIARVPRTATEAMGFGAELGAAQAFGLPSINWRDFVPIVATKRAYETAREACQ